jgi:hypothetical protein
MAAFNCHQKHRQNPEMTTTFIHKPTALRQGAVASCFWQAVDRLDEMRRMVTGRTMK